MAERIDIPQQPQRPSPLMENADKAVVVPQLLDWTRGRFLQSQQGEKSQEVLTQKQQDLVGNAKETIERGALLLSVIGEPLKDRDIMLDSDPKHAYYNKQRIRNGDDAYGNPRFIEDDVPWLVNPDTMHTIENNNLAHEVFTYAALGISGIEVNTQEGNDGITVIPADPEQREQLLMGACLKIRQQATRPSGFLPLETIVQAAAELSASQASVHVENRTNIPKKQSMLPVAEDTQPRASMLAQIRANLAEIIFRKKK